MPRVALGLEYDGTAFAGWQSQPHARSVQGELQRALSAVADHPVEVTAAGRTDAGVHALAQVVHFDTQRRAHRSAAGCSAPTAKLRRRGRACCGHGRCRTTFMRATARSSRTYRLPDPEPPLPAGARPRPRLLGRGVRSTPRAMHAAAQVLRRRARLLVVPRRGMPVAIDGAPDARDRASSARGGLSRSRCAPTRSCITWCATSPGALIAVGTGDATADWLAEVLASTRSHARRGVTAPPQGLYLAAVEYPAAFGLPPDVHAARVGLPRPRRRIDSPWPRRRPR